MKQRSAFLSIFSILFCIACAGQPLTEREKTLAVWDLDDVSPGSASSPHLGEFLAAEVIDVLKQQGKYRVIERAQLVLSLEELRLGSSDLVDESARLRLGKIAGARHMIFGAYQIIGNTMRLDLRMVDVETGKVEKAVEKTETSTDLQKRLHAARKAAEEF